MKQHVVVMSVELKSMVNCLSRVLSYYDVDIWQVSIKGMMT